jgi:hypothetical protein
MFARYGDPRALIRLMPALDEGGPFPSDERANRAVIELCAAVQALGGQLSHYQRRKRQRVLIEQRRMGQLAQRVARGNGNSQPNASATPENPTVNDPDNPHMMND